VATGVSRDFIQLLYDDALTARRRAIIATVLLLVLLGIGTWLWLPWGAAVHVGAVLAGGLVGWGLAAATAGRYELSLRGEWASWMRLAPACDNVQELARKVRGQRAAGRAYAVAAVLTLLWGLEVVLMGLAFSDGAEWLFVAPVVAANGAFAAGLLGHQLRLRSWSRQLAASLAEMVRDGEIAVWGVR
jgi:hypothetical protein